MSHRFTRSSSGARVKDGRLLFANRAVNIPMKPEGNKYFNLIESDIIIKPNEFEYGISFDYLDNTSMTGDLKTFNHKQDTPIIATLADVQIIHLTITQNINKKKQSVTKSLHGIHYFVQAYENDTLFKTITTDNDIDPQTQTEQQKRGLKRSVSEGSDRGVTRIQQDVLEIIHYLLCMLTNSSKSTDEIKNKCIVYLFIFADIIDRTNRNSNVANQDIYTYIHSIKNKFMQVIKGPLEIFKTVSKLYFNRELELQNIIERQKNRVKLAQKEIDSKKNVKLNNKIVSQGVLNPNPIQIPITNSESVDLFNKARLLQSRVTLYPKLANITNKIIENYKKETSNVLSRDIDEKPEETKEKAYNDLLTISRKELNDIDIPLTESPEQVDFTQETSSTDSKPQDSPNKLIFAQEDKRASDMIIVSYLRNGWSMFPEGKDKLYPGISLYFELVDKIQDVYVSIVADILNKNTTMCGVNNDINSQLFDVTPDNPLAIDMLCQSLDFLKMDGQPQKKHRKAGGNSKQKTNNMQAIIQKWINISKSKTFTFSYNI